jgi:acetyl esterase
MNTQHRLLCCTLMIFSVLARADAAPAILQAVGTYAVDESDVIYARAADVDLQAHMYRPQLKATLPAIIDIHGGAWSSGDRMSGRQYARALASAGMLVVSIDFRQAPQHQHPSASRDIAAAVRYVRSHATQLQIDAVSIGLVGSSSGGHLAMLAALMPNVPQFGGTQIAKDSGFANATAIDASVRYVIALWPVSDPAYRYDYAKRVGREELIKSHDSFFGSREAMVQASVPRVVRSKEAEHVPSLLLVQAGNDANIPREMTFDLLNAYQEAGGRLTYQFYPNQAHAFGHRASAETDRLVVQMRDFIAASLQ